MRSLLFIICFNIFILPAINGQNDDFELSTVAPITNSTQISGCVCTEGNFNLAGSNSCNLLGCCTTSLSGQSTIINCNLFGGYIDPAIGGVYPIYSVFGSTVNSGSGVNPTIPALYGTKILRLNNSIVDYSISKTTKTFSVTPANSVFRFAFLSVLATGHSCCNAGVFKVVLTNVNANTVIVCPSFSLTGPSPSCSTITPVPFYLPGSGNPYTGFGPYVFNKWKIQAIDLSQYMGLNVSIDFIASDCSAGGHYGYTYIDSDHSPVEILINNNPAVIINDTVNIVSCVPIATISAPANFASYQWTGPGAFTSTNSSISTSASGTYTLVIGQIGNCAYLTKIINLNIAVPSTSVNSTNSLICSGSSATLTAFGYTSQTWNNGATISSIVVSPTVTTTYSVSGTNINGCTSSNFFTLNVSAPVLTVSANNATICNGSSSTITANGAISYSWSNGAFTNSISVSPTASTIYTVTGTNTNNCSSAKMFTLVVLGSPTVNITSANDTICITESTTLTAGGAVAYSWDTGSTNASISISPSVTTIYSVVATALNGCQATFTFTQYVDLCMQLNELNSGWSENMKLKIFPNPNNGQFYLSGNKNNTQLNIKIFDINGKLIFQTYYDHENKMIDLGKEAKGIYILKAWHDKDLILSKKISVQ